MKKDFIIDERRVRRCDSNLSKMNVFEFAYYYVFHWGYFSYIFSCIYECLKGVWDYGTGLIYNLVCLILTPITLLICAIIQIKGAKKRCFENNKNIKGR